MIVWKNPKPNNRIIESSKTRTIETMKLRHRNISLWPVCCYLLPAICCLLMGGCRPRGVLSSRQMRLVLVDLHRADAVLQVGGYTYGHEDELGKAYQIVLEKHGVTQAQFDSSLVWYTDHPQIFDKIYPKVVKQLEDDNEQFLADNHLNEDGTEVLEPVRVLRNLDDIMREMQHGWPLRWPNPKEDEEKLQKNAEKFVYVINL